MKIRTLVCSKNRYFVECFSTYAMGRGGSEFEFSFFTEADAALNWLQNQVVDMVLADEFILANWQLTGKQVKVAISNRTVVHSEEPWNELNIYQRGVDMYEDLRKILATVNGGVSIGDKPKKIVTFYSPQGGSGKTTLAYISAMLHSREKNGVYVNLEEFGFTDHLYQLQHETSMEEVMFAIKDKRNVPVVISNAMKKDQRNVSVMPKMNYYSDLADFNAADVKVLLESIQQVSGESCIFVDISGGLTDKNKKVMEMSDVIFWVFEENNVGLGKMERIKKDQSIQGMEFFARVYFLINKSKVKKEDNSAIQIPYSESLASGVDVETVLSGNRDLYQKCLEIFDFINR